MSDVATVAISGAVSLISAFGSILLKDHLDRRRASYPPPAIPSPPPPGTSSGPSSLGPHVTTLKPMAPAPPTGPRAEPEAPTAVAGRGRTILLALLVVVWGFSLGLASRQVPNSAPLIFTLVLAPVVLLLFLCTRRHNRSAFGYQSSLLAYWTAMLAGQAISHAGSRIDDGPAQLAIGWLACAVLGGLVFLLTRRSASGSTHR